MGDLRPLPPLEPVSAGGAERDARGTGANRARRGAPRGADGQRLAAVHRRARTAACRADGPDGGGVVAVRP